MIRYSAPYKPSKMTKGDVFAARQYPRQAFGNLIDPVLNIDWFEMYGPTFPAHPHAGFSAVTYLFADSPNGFHNRDSLGEQHIINPGGLHWSRAAKGMIHEETPLPGGDAVRGLQIFVNLPALHQSDDAGAYAVLPDAVTAASGAGWTSRTSVNGRAVGSQTDALPAPVRIVEVAIKAGASFEFDLPAGWGGIMIALDGEVGIGGGRTLKTTQGIGFSADAAEAFEISAFASPARIAIVIGEQVDQPIHAHGPLMLASPKALEQARSYVATLSIPE